MADENKTIAVFDGDASGAKKAAADAAAAVRSQAAALEELASAEQAAASAADERARKAELQAQVRARAPKNLPIDMGGGGRAAIEEQEELLEITEEVKAAIRTEADILYGLGDAADDAGTKSDKAFKGGKASAEQYARVLSMIDPRLGALVQMATSLGSVFSMTIGKAAVLAGATAAIAASVSSILGTIEKAAKSAKDAIDQVDRAEEKRRSQRAGVGEQLALHGVGDQASRNVAAGYVEELTKRGFSQNTAEITAAAVVAAKRNGQQISTDQMADLAALQEQGAVQLTRGTNVGATAVNVTEAMRGMRGMTGGNQQALVAGQEQRARTRMDLMEAIRGGNEEAAKRYLMEEQGFSAETAAERVGDLISMARGKDPRVLTEDTGLGVPTILVPGSAGYNRVKSANDRMMQQYREDRTQAEKTLRGLESRQRSLPGGSAADNGRNESEWSAALAAPPATEPTPDATDDEAKRRQRVADFLRGMQGNYQKATMSPEELLRTQLTEMGASPADIGQAIDLQRQTAAAVEASKQADKSPPASGGRGFSPAQSTQTRFNPDAQNQPQQVTHNVYVSGLSYWGGPKDPSKMRTPRSPAR